MAEADWLQYTWACGLLSTRPCCGRQLVGSFHVFFKSCSWRTKETFCKITSGALQTWMTGSGLLGLKQAIRKLKYGTCARVDCRNSVLQQRVVSRMFFNA